MIVALLMLLVIAASLVSLWFIVGAITRMSPHTRLTIRAAFITKATGLFVILAAGVDHFLGAPYTWPWLMLGGVTLANAGTAMLHLANRRGCRCSECPVRRVVVLTDARHE